MKFVTSWDDGNTLDYELAKLLLKYRLPGIFYIPTNCEMLPIDIVRLSESGFEIGAHTNSHSQNLHHLELEEQIGEIRENKIWLEEMLGKKVTSFCYPRGKQIVS